ncbi:MAG: Type I Iterative PKS [Bogoriella megaspora]|nr:MAG: Type I Iterative PKS [Bogoriella megaspora]
MGQYLDDESLSNKHWNKSVLEYEGGEGCSTAGCKSGLKPVAVCGVALRLPGGINSTSHLWNALRDGRDMRGPIPESRYCTEGFNGSLGNKGEIKTQYGYFLDQDIARFDPSAFSLNEDEVKRTDPQQRLLLEIVKECFENAGEREYRGKNIGCYVGTFGEDWLHSQSKEDQHSGGYIMSGQIDLMLANRISYENDLRGPSMVIKTGCSASLIALHEACRAIQLGDCAGAVVAGANLILGPTLTAAMTAEGILSPEGSCKTFDSKADGFARGEAITAVYLQRLDRAIEQRLPVRAVITNTGANSDGRSHGLLQPSTEAQLELMRKVHGDVHSDPARTAFVECHGTGTPTGDPIEATAVGQMFGSNGVYIGSVKPNLGHSEGASGISSLLKAILMLEKSMIVPNIKFHTPNSQIPFEKYRLQVPKELTPWPRNRDLRVAINSFGIGGSNVHVIVEHPYLHISRMSDATCNIRLGSPQLLLMSASTSSALQALSKDYKAYIQANPDSLPDLSYTLARRREHRQHRTFAICTEGEELKTAPVIRALSAIPEVTMIFSGQGAQWAQMGCDLLRDSEEFRQAIGFMDNVLRTLRHPPNWSIESELQKPVETSAVSRAELSQPLCTALQIALFEVLRAGCVRPSAVVGHSSGEIAAAYATGAISMEESIIVAYYRGFITRGKGLKGGMAAVGLDAKTTSNFLKSGVVIACENSPSSTTISGDEDAVLSILENVKAHHEGVLARALKVDMAYHSPHMDSLADAYFELLREELRTRQTSRKPPLIPMYSSVFNEKITSAGSLTPEYWVSNLISPVRFSMAMENALRENGTDLLVEVGPHSALAGPLRQICSAMGAPYNYCPTLTRYSNSTNDVLAAFGTLYQQGLKIDDSPFFPDGEVLTDLPVYPWDHSTPYWYESRTSNAWRLRRFGHHQILGLRVPQTTDKDPVWRVMLNLEDVPWMADHKVMNDIVFPFAGYVAMAGEAFRQLTSIEDGYAIRHITVATAMIIDEVRPLEVVTSLKIHYLTDVDIAGNTFDFTVSSYTGSTWIQHCKGLIGPPGKSELSKAANDSFPRRVIPSSWYGDLARLGLAYGPAFRGIEKLTASTKQMVAAAKVSNYDASQASSFCLHPAMIDAMFQVGLAAITNGLCRHFSEPRIPTLIEDLQVWHNKMDVQCTATCSEANGELSIDGHGTDGKSCLRVRGIRLTPLANDGLVSDEDKYAAARLEWVPDYDFQDVFSLIKTPAGLDYEKRIIEELALLCIAESLPVIRNLEPSMSHLGKYRMWLERIMKEAMADGHPVLKKTSALVSLTTEERYCKIESLRKEASSAPLVSSFVEGIMRIHDNIEDIFTGATDPLELLLRENNLAQIYDAISFDYSNFICTLSDTVPNLRILEIGAGTGGTTELVLRGMQNLNQHPRYSKYTFTDISAGFFPKARERFSNVLNMDFKVFDISQSPFTQGFEPGSYDLILAANVIHATPSLFQTLKNLQPLLSTRGQLVLTEFVTNLRAPNYVYGNFSGWWLGEADGREWQPYVNVARWDEELKAAGFNGASDVVLDAAEPWQYCATIISRKSVVDIGTAHDISLVCGDPDLRFNQHIFESLKQTGLNPRFVGLQDAPTVTGDLIVSLDLEMSFLDKIDKEDFLLFQEVCRNLDGKNLLWLMPPTQIKCTNPRGSQSLGLIRTARSELDISITTLEIHVEVPNFGDLVEKVFHKMRSQKDQNSLAPDREFVIHENTIKVGRYRPFDLHDELLSTWLSQESLSHPVRVNEFTTSSILPGTVEIDVCVVGPSLEDASKKKKLGARQVCGVVRSVGESVKNVKDGERVFAMSSENCIADRIIVDATLAAKLPDEIRFENAAAIPLAFSTALHALVDVGQLKKGQIILIHDAVANVGQAAVQICRLVGAEIYATCADGTESAYLAKKYAIPSSRIFDSRSTSFLPSLRQATQEKGADIVLNTLTGDLLHATWECVAEFGKLVELGKHDLETFGKLQMNPFLANRSYICVNMDHLIRERPTQAGAVLEKCRDLFIEGKFQPLDPVISEDASSFPSLDCIRKHNSNSNALSTVSADAANTRSVSDNWTRKLDPNASYLITGGLGGLGKAIAIWMVERGARHLTFLSPNAGLKLTDQTLFTELESMGCTTVAVQGVVQSEDDVSKAIKAAQNPVKGVIHLAMQLRDAFVVDMTFEDWQAVLEPKVDGTWILHRQLQDPLDFFIMTSSLSTVFYQPGQSNYNAANTFMESFCQYRHSLGLPASVLSVCPIEGVGYVAENSEVRRKLKSQGHWFLDERALLEFLELTILNGKPWAQNHNGDEQDQKCVNKSHIIMGLRSEIPLDDSTNRSTWRRDRRMGIYHNIAAEKNLRAPGGWSELKDLLIRATDQPDLLNEQSSKVLLAQGIGRKIFNFIMRSEEDMDVSLSLAQVGLDSLMAIELRRWWKQMFGVEITTLEIMSSGTIRELGEAAASSIRKRLAESA